jgi:hypothetical protein
MELIFKKLYDEPEHEYHLDISLGCNAHGDAYAYNWDAAGNKVAINYKDVLRLEKYWRSDKYSHKMCELFVTPEYFADNFYLSFIPYEIEGKHTIVEELVNKGIKADFEELYPENGTVNEAANTFNKILNGCDNREVQCDPKEEPEG